MVPGTTLLSVGLVVATAFVVGLVAMWVLAIPVAAAFALGAVVGPPDAVSTTAIARRIGLPRRVTTVLEGESLLNDATAIVCLRTATVAIGGSVTVWAVAWGFALSLVGGVVVGVAVATAVELVRKHVTDTVTDTALSFMTPFIAYLPAEEIHASGVLAVVIAGLLLAHKALVLQTASSRLSERINWSTISFLLENTVFLLIGLQVPGVIGGVVGSGLSAGRIVLFCAAVLGAVIVVRPAWVFPARYLLIRPGHDARDGDLPRTSSAIVSWAGSRGVVTLAAAFVLPNRTPDREVIVLAALVVVGGTLLLQGLTLPMLARRLDVHGPDGRDDALQETTILQAAVNAALAAVEQVGVNASSQPEAATATRASAGSTGSSTSRSTGTATRTSSETPANDPDAAVIATLRERAATRTNTIWERLGNDDGAETPSQAYRRLRMVMLSAERAEVLRIRDEGGADHEVLSQVMGALDLEESMLDHKADRPQRQRAEPLTAQVPQDGGCKHLRAAAQDARPTTPNGCGTCLVEGSSWVHLRMCLSCGYIGCCDSSPRLHAQAHFEQTQHPVMRSFEPGEAWRWCYVDGMLG